jgi:23S rRNA G2069 N7-methylase RlmK/C1962 C5-methylase RlmI
MKKINILLLTILFITGCQSGDTEQIVTIGNKYSVSLPSFLVKASTTLNEDASLQYLHTWKEFYVIVIDESKSEMQKALEDNNLTDDYANDIDGYSSLILDNFEQVISISNKSEIVTTQINNMPARLITINGRTEGIDAFYSLAFIQGKERYYQVMAWTLSNKEYAYKEKMKKIMYSLKEL